MLHKPILGGRIGKWVYSLVEYDLNYEHLQVVKGQVMADFMVDHMIGVEGDAHVVEISPWDLYFDGSMCGKGQGIGCVFKSPSGVVFSVSLRLEFTCTNNQVEYKALLHELEYPREIGVTSVNAFADSLLVVQQIRGESQCLDEVLNSYHERCLDIVGTMDYFCIKHIPRERNREANVLLQQASGYEVTTEMFEITRSPATQVSVYDSNESANCAREQQRANAGPAKQEVSSSITCAHEEVIGTSAGPGDACDHRIKLVELLGKAQNSMADEETNV
jgi:ribonuclease HI